MTRDGWREIALGDYCNQITVGHVGPMADRYVDHGIPFLRSQDISPFSVARRGTKFIDDTFDRELGKSRLRAGDVVVVRTGYPGTAAVVPQHLDGANCADLVIIRPGPELDPWFVAALFNSTWGRGQVGGVLVGVAQQHFNVSAAKAMRVRIPPLIQQQAIGGLIRGYSELIDVNDERNACLEKMTRCVFDSVTSDAEDGASTLTTIGEIANVTKGLSYKGDGLAEAGMPLINLKCFAVGGGFRRGGLKAYVGQHANRHLAYPDEILVANTDLTQAGTIIGSPLMVPRDIEAAIFTHHVSALRLNQDWLQRRHYVFELLRSGAFRQHAKGHASGTTVLGLRSESIERFEFVRPPRPILDRVESQLADLHRMSSTLEQSNNKLIAARDLLVPRLVMGEVTLTEPIDDLIAA